MTFAEGHFCTHDYSDELEEAEGRGYDQGFREGRSAGARELRDYIKELLVEIERRRDRAELPHPLNGLTITLDELEEMIRR